MRDFLRTSAGKATLGVGLTCLILAWPPAANWLVAALTLAFALHHFRESFRRLDAAPTGAALRVEPPTGGTALAAPARGGPAPAARRP